ncbi:MAG: DUF4383 domain-containing protein [Actinomycetota bacterium]|nr:DUF4383 domain-containing protein [Actinomycetota bacterium]
MTGLALCGFAAMGFAGRLDFFSTTGTPVAGMSTNGLLCTLSVVSGAVLLVAAARGGRFASTTAVVVGALFFLSGVANVLVLNSPYNVLAFRMSNVVFSLVVGAVLALCGTYGRIGTGTAVVAGPDRDQRAPVDGGDVQATRELAYAERAVAAGGGTSRERELLSEVAVHRDAGDRRAAWRRLGGT